jgi:hypothetical protein
LNYPNGPFRSLSPQYALGKSDIIVNIKHTKEKYEVKVKRDRAKKGEERKRREGTARGEGNPSCSAGINE